MGAGGSKVLQKQGCVRDSSARRSLAPSLLQVWPPGRPEAVRCGDTPGTEKSGTPTDLTTEGRGGLRWLLHTNSLL